MNSIATPIPCHIATNWKDPHDEIAVILYLLPVGSKEVKPAYFSQTFSALPVSLALLWITFFFKNTHTFSYFYKVLYLSLVGSEGAYKILHVGGTACTPSWLCPIFITVCF